MRSIRVALLEPEESFHSELGDGYTQLFKEIQYLPRFQFFTDKDALPDYLQNEECDVVVCDLSLGDRRDFQGLNLLQGIKMRWPDIFCIGNTSFGDLSYRKTSAKQPTFDVFVSKDKLVSRDKKYITLIAADIAKRLKINPSITLHKDSSIFFEHLERWEQREILSIVKQVTFSGHQVDGCLTSTKALLTRLHGGRSKSKVFRLELVSQAEGIHSIPAVLKISQEKYARKELQNYMNFVKWFLPSAWRAEVLGFGTAKEYGGVCYAFVTDESDKFESLTWFIQNQRHDLIESVINDVFDPARQLWYKKSLISEEKNINERYWNRYFVDPTFSNQSADTFCDIIQESFGIIRSGEAIIRGQALSLPLDELFGKPHGSYHTCICHGDLNSNNIIVSNKGRMLIIDFQDTGRGHVFEDYVALEASIRLYFPHNSDDPYDWLDLEDKLNQEQIQEPSHTYAYYILKIRRAAFCNFAFEPRNLYFYAVAAFHFRLLRIRDLSDKQKIRISAAILAALQQIRKR